MDKNIYFKNWIHNWNWGMRTALFLILMFTIIQFSLFSLTQNYVVSYFGAQPEDVTFSIQVTYISLLFTLPLQIRFLNYFNTKKYLITVLLIGIILNLLSMKTTEIEIFILLRFLQGMIISFIAGGMLTFIFSRLHEEKKMAVGYSVFYGTLLGSSVVAGAPSAWIIDNTDWKMIYYVVILFQIISILIVFLIFKSEREQKKYPLYQIDWKAYLILGSGMFAVAYCLVYGPKHYWFDDKSIVYSFFLAIILISLFVLRQLNSKRPIIHFSIFKSKRFVIGLFFLALFYGLKDTINLVYNYVSVINQWSNYDYIELAAVNISGMALTMYIASQLVAKKKFPIHYFLILGFILMLAFNFWMYKIISPGLDFSDLMIPIFLQGASSGMLFVPIATFILSSVPVHTGISGSLVGGTVRFFTTLNSFAGYYTLQLFYNQHYKEQFLKYLTPYDLNYAERNSSSVQSFISKGFTPQESVSLANSSILKSITIQTQLLTNQTIFLGVSYALIGIILVVLSHFIYRKLSLIQRNSKSSVKNITIQGIKIQ
ncbi:MFS transporter [Flavobacterium qiangtangense]|uniref:MFS transporter n=1 Tax=Flavobacterium qiangtangense TaxID=1442595 RepID=A0ABW1PRD7_9FLAO